MLEMKQVDLIYPDGYPAIRQLTLQVKPGESVGIVGANGAGKSTLLMLLCGIKPVAKGEILFDGLAINQQNLAALRQKIGYIFQNPDDQVFMTTVGEDIAFGIRNSGNDEAEVKIKVEDILRQLNITHLRDKATYKLSSGEKRLVAIAGVLAMKPKLILFDEPTTFLDLKGRRNFIHILRHLEISKIIATHDLEMVLELCPRVLVLDQGRLVADGDPKEIFQRGDFMVQVNLEIPASLR